MGRRVTLGRHARFGSPSVFRQLLSLLGIAVAVVMVASVAVGAYVVGSLRGSLSEEAVALEAEVAEPPSLGPYESEFTLLLVGTDECEEELRAQLGARCEGADAGGQLNDVNMLMHVSAEPRRVTVVSFPRDLELPIPSCASPDGSVVSAMSKQPLNSAYSYGELGCVAKTISDLTGQEIPFAAKVSFGNVVNITDAIGGVEVCIGNGGIRDPHTGIDLPAGMHTVQGFDALQFLRTRHGVGDESDLARIGNQQQYMSRLVHKLRSDEILTNLPVVLDLANTAARNITPSESLTDPVRIVQLALTLKDVPFDDITFVQYPVLTDPDNANHVVPDRAAASVLWDALERNVPIDVSGKTNSNGGVIDANPQEQPEPTPDSTATPPTPVPTGTGAAEDRAVLPENINGVDATVETCSAGNVAANG